MTADGPSPSGSPPLPVAVFVTDEQDAVPLDLDLDRYRQLASEVLAAEGVAGPAELTITFVDEDHIAGLNATYLDGDGPTDVLAFPLDDADGDPDERGPGPLLLGDVVICPTVAARYAAGRDRPVADELALLVVHGILHVLGHDHADDDEALAMRGAEHAHLTTRWDPAWTWDAGETAPPTGQPS